LEADIIFIGKTSISLVQGDITLESTDAIVNAANSSLMGGGGLDGAIHRAGGKAILVECLKIVAKQGPLAPGRAVITTGGSLKTRFVIHTVGPVWQGGMNREASTLASAYTQSLKLAASKGFDSIAFPSISTGAYGYPVEQAAVVALGAVSRFLRENSTSLKEIRFVLYDTDTLKVYEKALELLAPHKE
jgi:O-acetyl-ADP-ribose deacetylase (regulator of RNase III)